MLVLRQTGERDACTYPILLEVGVVADDGGCIGAFLLPDLVGGAVGVEITEVVGRSVVRRIVSSHCEMRVIKLCSLGII
jgi:hypothetical protein